MEKWLKMTDHGAGIRSRISHLERNFNVSAVVFKKYKEIFPHVFKQFGVSSASSKPQSSEASNRSTGSTESELTSSNKQANRTRKSTANARQQSNYEITSADIYYFCWVLYINIKATRPAIGEDLVNSYHLLLACIDFCYSNALVSKFAHDVLNPNFEGLPENFHDEDFKMMNPTKQSMCVLQTLCNKWDGISVDAKGIREHWLKPYIKELAQRKILQLNAQLSSSSGVTDPSTLYLGLFDSCNFESNMAKLTKEHDLTMLTAGDFDERIFLSENAHKELGAPVYDLSDLKRMLSERDKSCSVDKQQEVGKISASSTPSSTTSSAELDKQKPSLENGGRFVPQTPLSNRNYLANKAAQPSSPVANATRKVGDLYRMLSECTGEPTASLEDIFKLCTQNPRKSIMDRASRMVDRFIDAYTTDQEGDQPQAIELARKRADLARKLYFKVLEQIIVREQNRLPTDRIGESLSSLLGHDIFHISLFACCVEIVLASHNALKRTFPWVLEVYKNFHETQPLFPFLFYKVIELVIREEERLSRDIVKHLATIEERVLDSMAWEADSPLWTAIAAHGSIPSCQDVVLPPTSNDHHNPFETSPLSALRRHHEVFQSPMPVTGRYSMTTSLETAGARRRLFDGGPSGDNSSTSSTASSTTTTTTSSSQIFQVVVPHRAENGDIRYTIMNATGALVSDNHHISFTSHRAPDQLEPTPAPIRPAVRANPVNLFFRKVYYLAQLRFRDLWNRLSIRELTDDSKDDLQRKIWTLFEDQIRNHTNLLRDRHLDQMIMCSTYAVIRVCRTDRSSTFFQEIMKAYRFQPQANIEVYRNVLLSKPPLKLLDDSGPTSTSSITTRSSPNKRVVQSPIKNGNGCGSGQSSSGSSGSSHHHQQQPLPERGDLIAFYNLVYLPQMKESIVRFATHPVSLSPLPRMNTHPISPWRRVSQQHPVYVSPLKHNSSPASPGRQLSYNFHRSPAKDLQTINNMVNRKRDACKRILQDDDGENTKRPCYSDVEIKRINDIMNDRRSSK